MNIFGINSNCAFIFIMSMVSGFPSNAKYAKELYENNIITDKEATKILTFTHFSNPLFILGSVATSFLNNKEAGTLILIVHYSTNIIIGLIFRNYYKKTDKNNISIFNLFKKINNRIKKSESFGTILTTSINSTISTLLTILGTVTTFLVITTIINRNIHLNNFYQSILNGIFEVTQGLKYISLLNIPLRLKATISCMLLSFGGMSVHMQIISIINGTKIKYIPFLIARIMHATISGILIYLVFDLFLAI